jgi:hypothetical protein
LSTFRGFLSQKREEECPMHMNTQFSTKL